MYARTHVYLVHYSPGLLFDLNMHIDKSSSFRFVGLIDSDNRNLGMYGYTIIIKANW
jgi:hypothetical protein